MCDRADPRIRFCLEKEVDCATSLSSGEKNSAVAEAVCPAAAAQFTTRFNCTGTLFLSTPHARGVSSASAFAACRLLDWLLSRRNGIVTVNGLRCLGGSTGALGFHVTLPSRLPSSTVWNQPGGLG